MEIVKRIQQFISYWYVRYLLVTELYMVETWEKVIVHILFAIIFGLFWYFNYSIIMSGISQLRSSTSHDVEQVL
ncbi:serine palmitoyltransferase small subunit A [Helicoverpa armigera]|uniref:serine palmitoyltransferase small subunit A n=1 Tax=Helicoverpa armigera TaxID=29058 RepID=UPI0021120AEF|nr:serine palmitoyltransferase small subunit A [Helicoverpa armigera]